MTRSTEENRRYMAEYRLRTAGGGLSLLIPGDGGHPDLQTHRSVEALVLSELHMIPNVAKHPGKVAALLTLGRLLDDESQRRVHPAAVNQLRAGLDELWAAGEDRPVGRLEALREKSRPGA